MVVLNFHAAPVGEMRCVLRAGVLKRESFLRKQTQRFCITREMKFWV